MTLRDRGDEVCVTRGVACARCERVAQVCEVVLVSCLYIEVPLRTAPVPVYICTLGEGAWARVGRGVGSGGDDQGGYVREWTSNRGCRSCYVRVGICVCEGAAKYRGRCRMGVCAFVRIFHASKLVRWGMRVITPAGDTGCAGTSMHANSRTHATS